MYRNYRLLTSTMTGFVFAAAVAVSLSLPSSSANAGGKGGAFVGGLIGGHVLTNMANQSERRTRAAEYQAYSQPRQAAPAQAPAPAPAQTAQSSAQERLDTLDKLAANGMITKEEYDRRRQANIDGI